MTQRSKMWRVALATSLAVAGLGLSMPAALAQGYGGPSYDRGDGGERDSFSHRRHGWEGRGSDSGGWMERFARRQFERGYRLGRRDALDETDKSADLGGSSRDGAAALGKESEDRVGGSDRDGPDDRTTAQGESPERLKEAVKRARDSLQEARAALEQNERRNAEDALERAERALRPAGAEQRPSVERSLDALERALDRDDRQAALRALRHAREAARGDKGATAAGDAGSDPKPEPKTSTVAPGAANPPAAAGGGGPKP